MDGAALDRVITFSHNTMPAASLPLELQHHIFSYLDSRSFYAARKVCRWWHLASLDTMTLGRQLEKLPIEPSVNTRAIAPAALRRLFGEASRKLLLGTRVHEVEDANGKAISRARSGLFARPKIAAVSRGERTVTINGGWLALFDTAQEPPAVLLQRQVNNMIEGARLVPWLNIAPAASYALALSSKGDTLAVAQERTIQIYDLRAGPESATVSRTIASAAGHYIQGVDFEQCDRVLRVQLSGKGTVLYLGTPDLDETLTSPPADTMAFWASPAGLRHTFLDSSLLQPAAPATGAEHYAARLSGLQLLRPSPAGSGFLFAAQRHGGNESSRYLYGHVRCSPPADGLPPAAEPAGVTVLACLESFLSVWDRVKEHADGNGGLGAWEEMPSAHEHHPRFVLSGPDGALLLLAEREKKHVRHVKWTQVFVYGVPSLRRVGQVLKEGEERGTVRWKRLARFLNDEGEEMAAMEEAETRREVARLPLSVGMLAGEARDVRFQAVGESHTISVTTEEAQRTWRLCEV